MGLGLELWVGWRWSDLMLRMVKSGLRNAYVGVFCVRKRFRLGLGVGCRWV